MLLDSGVWFFNTINHSSIITTFGQLIANLLQTNVYNYSKILYRKNAKLQKKFSILQPLFCHKQIFISTAKNEIKNLKNIYWTRIIEKKNNKK